MRYLEIRRHTMRTIPGKHLSQPGVALARALGGGVGPFARVVTSPLPRAIETAIAMGFAVDQRLDHLKRIDAGVEEEANWWDGFAAFSRAVRRGDVTARYAGRLAGRWRRLAATLAEETAMLIISHGGIIEAGCVGCLPDADHAAWGRALDYCEGVRLAFDGTAFTGAELLRLRDHDPIDQRITVTAR